MKYTEIRKIPELSISEEDEYQLASVLSHRQISNYIYSGRSSYITLIDPIKSFDGKYYRSLKIKGSGFFDVNTFQFKLPSTDQFERLAPHFGFDALGRPIRCYSSKAPFGGITVEKAIAEYENAKALFANGALAIRPLRVVRYEEMRFLNQEIGAVASLCFEPIPLRFLQLLWDYTNIDIQHRVFYNQVAVSLNIPGEIHNFVTRSRLIQLIAKMYGGSIRQFSESGLCLHSGGWSNIEFSTQHNTVALTDLDSSLSLSKKQKSLRAAYALRDLVSCLYRLLISIYHPNAISAFDNDLLVEHDFLLELLTGYFLEIEKSKLSDVSLCIWDFYFESCFNRIKSFQHRMRDIPPAEQPQYELPMMGFYDFCMAKLYPLFLNCRSNTINDRTMNPYSRFASL